jgi:uncharacterized protein
MKVHVHQIAASGLHLEGQEETEILELQDPNVQPLENIHYSLDIGISGSSLHAIGRLWLEVDLECVACLRHFVYPLIVDPFVAQIELTGPEAVDLTPAIREDILLALPLYPKCDWDGKTVCPGPLGTGSTTQDAATASNAWDALDELKLKRKI